MIYQFEDFELDTDQLELRQENRTVKTDPMAFSLLTYLVENHERVVSKDDINTHVWQGRFVSDSALSFCVHAVRAALNDNGKDQRLIKTVHGKGFRFVGTPTLLSAKAGSDTGLALPDKPSIAVLPFDNMSGDPEQDYFADGMCEDIITALSKIPKLFVIARNSTFTYKGNAVDIRQVGREQGVRYVLEGSVRRSGDRLRITAQLIDAQSGAHIRADRYDRDISDIFELQDEMTRKIVSAMQIELTEGEQARMWLGGTENYQAWECQIRAPNLINTHRKEDVLKGRELAARAIALDENFASATTSLGVSHFIEAIGGWGENPLMSFGMAKALFEKSLRLDDTNPLTYAMLGLIHAGLRDYDRAYELAQKSMVLGSNNTEVASTFALVSIYCDQMKDLSKTLDAALRHCPILHAWHLAMVALVHFLDGRREEAIALGEKVFELDPNYLFNLVALIAAYTETGHLEKAMKIAEVIKRVHPHYTIAHLVATQPFKNTDMVGRLINGLKKAGWSE